MDRYIKGEEVESSALKHVWQDTTGLTEEFDLTISEEFFRAVRTVNSKLSPERRLRVLLGDPPIEWEKVRTFEDVLKWGDQRDFYAADLIRREVLAKQRRALVIYGRGHFQRKNARTNFETDDFLAGILTRGQPGKVFNIWPVGGTEELQRLPVGVAAWRVPSLALLKGTGLGTLDVSAYFPDDPRLAKQGERFAPIAREQWRAMRMEDQFDALLNLGPTLTLRQLSKEMCSDTGYVELRTSRMALAPGGQANANRLKQRCLTLAAR